MAQHAPRFLVGKDSKVFVELLQCTSCNMTTSRALEMEGHNQQGTRIGEGRTNSRALDLEGHNQQQGT